MQNRLLALAAILTLTASVPMAVQTFAQSSDRWYIGQSAQANTYYTYTIQDIEVNDGSQFTMSIYFKEQDSNGNWIAPVYVVEDNGNVLNGTLSLGENLAIQ